jgi:cytochrome P450
MDISPDMPFSKAFDHASAVTNSRFTNPFWRLQTFLFGRSFRRSCAKVHDFGASVVQNAKSSKSSSSKASETSPTSSNLITSLLAHISDPATVAASATNYLSAGRDTTAQTLTWTFHLLLSNPNTIAPLLAAIEDHWEALRLSYRSELTQKSGPTSFTSFSQLERPSLPLPFSCLSPVPNSVLLPFHAAFAESLRLTPAVPFEIKETVHATELPDGTRLPSGAAVLWVPFAMARNPLIWGSDAKEFRPERWMVRDSAAPGSHLKVGNTAAGVELVKEEENQEVGHRTELLVKNSFENPVFNAGPRLCVGKKLAESLAVWVLAKVFWGWQLQEADEEERVVGESLTAPMEGGLPVKVWKRV